MNLENQGESRALIVDESKKSSNILLSIEPKKENVYNYMKEIKLKEGQHFQLIPNISWNYGDRRSKKVPDRKIVLDLAGLARFSFSQASKSRGCGLCPSCE